MSVLAVPPAHKDRTALLIVVGLLVIGLALLLLLMAGLMVTAALVTRAPSMQQPGMNIKGLIGAVSIYLLMSVFFGAIGVGTLRGRRWAGTLGLAVAWIWLAVGIFGMALMSVLWPKMLDGMQTAEGTALRADFKTLFTAIMFASLSFVYVILPALLLLFYRSRNVRATFFAKDPSIPWTDRTPAPLLALSLMLGGGAICAMLGIGNGAVMVVGRIVTGAPAIVGLVVLSAINAVLAFAVYRRRPIAWWGLMGLFGFGCLSFVLFLARGEQATRELYEAMGLASPELERMGLYAMWSQPPLLVVSALALLAYLGFLIWVRKFFRPTEQVSTP